MVNESRDTDAALTLLRASLSEAQTTVRSYDAKAQIVGIGYIFALGVIGQFEDAIPRANVAGLGYVLVAWIVVILPIMLFGSVLYPSRKMAPRIERNPPQSLRYLLFIDPEKFESVQKVSNAAMESQPINEISYELLRMSHLRELKRTRFLRGLFGAAFCFMFLFATQVLGSRLIQIQ